MVKEKLMERYDWQQRTELLLGEEKMERIRNAHVLVVGLGGVGAYAAEMICRAGVGRMTIVDADTVQPTNMNRQLPAMHSTLGRTKAEVLAARYKDINPAIELTVLPVYLKDENIPELLDADKYDFIVVNFANPDMVGHTGVIPAAVAAVEKVDECVGTAVEAVKKADGVLFICADHGNAEQLVDYETGEPFTAHTTNPVPFILVNADPSYGLREGGKLADIIPTLIELMGMEQPKEMTGASLLIKR